MATKLDVLKSELLELVSSFRPMAPDLLRWSTILLPAWFCGRMDFSFLWVVFIFIAFQIRNRDKLRKAFRNQFQLEAAKNEAKAIAGVVKEAPSWIYFPNRERAEWLNKTLKQLWPFLDDYVSEFVTTTLQKTIQDTVKSYSIDKFTFEKMTLGDDPLRVDSVKMLKMETTERAEEVVFDLEISYKGDAQVKVDLVYIAVPMRVGIKNLSFNGKLRVEMQNFCGQVPIVGSICCFFLNDPVVDFDLTNIADFMDVPVLKTKMMGLIKGTIAYMMVLPNRYPVPLMNDVDTNLLRNPLPKGILRLHLIDAVNLKGSSFLSKADPYVAAKVGGQKKTSTKMKDNEDPVWNQILEFVIWSSEQQLEVSLMDGDTMFADADDPLGHYEIKVATVKRLGYLAQSVKLEEMKAHDARLNLRLLWASFTTDLQLGKAHCPDENYNRRLLLSQKSVSSSSSSSGGAGYLDADGYDPLLQNASRAFLLVHLYAAENLPSAAAAKAAGGVKAILTVIEGHAEMTKEASSVQIDASAPKWEEAFQFLLRNFPEYQKLSVSIVDASEKQVFAKWVFPLVDVLRLERLTLPRQWFNEGAHPSSSSRTRRHAAADPPRIELRLCLRLMDVDKNVIDVEEAGPEAVEGRDGVDRGRAERIVDKRAERSLASTRQPPTSATATPTAGPHPSSNAPSSWRTLPRVSLDQIEGSGLQSKGDESNCGFGLIRLTVEIREVNLLHVIVHECQGLVAADKEGNTDPYVKISILDKGDSQKTKVVEDNLNPRFEQPFSFNLGREIVQQHRLQVVAKNDKGFFSREVGEVGRRVVDLADFKINQTVTRWFALKAPEDD